MRSDLLLWLAESKRNFNLAGPGLTAEMAADLAVVAPWAHDICYADLPLPYEPRSLARSLDGKRIAVGTKAGILVLATWNGGGWNTTEITPASPPRSIRALRFIDDTTLVAGWGEGFFGIFDARSGKPLHPPVKSAPADGAGAGSSPERQWLGRLARFISLVPTASPLEPESAVVLGVTIGSEVHVLYRTATGYEARTSMPEILPRWRTAARVVDGIWSHNLLWVLDSAGRIYRYGPACGAPLPGTSARIRLHPVETDGAGARETDREGARGGIFTLDHPRDAGEFRAIAACVMGLAVLTSDDVTFLRFRMPKAADGGVSKDVPWIEPSTAHWVAVPSAIDCSVCLPFGNRYLAAPRAEQKITEDDPVWTVVSTARPGLHWIRWHDPEGKEGGRLPAVSLAHRAGAGDSSVLQVRCVYHNWQEQTFIACATRDQRLRLATILDRYATRDLLAAEIPGALDKNPQLAEERGIACWLAGRRIAEDFAGAPAAGVSKLDRPRHLLRLTERDDLYRLLRLVFQGWIASNLPAEARRTLLRRWICQILARAYHVEPALPQELAKLAYARIAKLSGGNDEVELFLGPFAAFLRKWGVYGHTYGTKPQGLLQLYHWNDRSHHHLDGLSYLTKLLRQHVDRLWEARPAGTQTPAAIWDLVAPASGDFSIHSRTDGGIFALDSTGEPMAWHPVAAGGAAALEQNHHLQITQGKLRHRQTEEFLRKYHHGPSARALLLLPASHDAAGPFLLVFCIRGWRPEDRTGYEEERSARLYVLVVRRDPDAKAMRVEAIDSRRLPADLYGFCELTHLTERGRRHVLVAGTKGAWQADSKGAAWKVRPFVELTVQLGEGSGSQVRIDIEQEVTVEHDPHGERSVFSQEAFLPEAAHNPCWSLAAFTSDAGQHWLWGGFHDGHLRCFLRQQAGPASWRWIEGDQHEGEARFTSRVPGFAASAPIWRLHVVQDRQVLAYGTSDGIIGAFSLETATPVEGKREATWEEMAQRTHLTHHRESSPICGLLSYDEPEGGKRLMAVTQGGVVVILDLDLRVAQATETSRFRFQGLLLDRFALGHEARAAAIVQTVDEPYRSLLRQDSLPAVLVGSKEGSVVKHLLALPRGTGRRRIAFQQWCAKLFAAASGDATAGVPSPATMRLFVGDDLYAWLRVLDVRGPHLLRYSIAHDLRHNWPDEGLPLLASAGARRAYIEHLNELADDVYGRRPLTPEPAKIIWEEAARAANAIANLAINQADDSRQALLLAAFLELNQVVDDLCNRWIGSAQAVESRVLMHTFNCLFSWEGVVLIGLERPSAAVRQARNFLLHNMIQRRLSFNDRLVQLETLRTINVALMRAVRHCGTTAAVQRWRLRLRPPDPYRDGLHDLLTMAGDLGERHVGSLTPADPLWTELSRFFAASLLLLPQASFVISQIVAESRLTERDVRFAGAVSAHAEVLVRQLDVERTATVEDALREFDDSFDQSIDDTIQPPFTGPRRGKPESAWGRLLAAEKRARVIGRRTRSDAFSNAFSNDAFLVDHAAVIRTAASLIPLRNPEPLAKRERTWLDLNTESPYFKHSQRYLRHMEGTWKMVRELAGFAGADGKTGREWAAASIKNARDLCDVEIGYVKDRADLFEPQRSQYVEIVKRWRDQVLERAEEAVGVLDVLDRFNRHTYRASSDRLMSSISELAFQTAPLWLDRIEGLPLRAEVDRRLAAHPVVRAIFDSGNRLVASTHLAGTLFTVARNYFLGAAPAARQTTFKEIQAGLDKFCSFEEVKLIPFSGVAETDSTPGTIAVWDTILQEVVVNARKYCKPEPALTAAWWKQGGMVRIALAGNKPFLGTLLPDKRGDVEVHRSPARRLEELRKLAKKATDPGERLAFAEPEGSSGMGLTLILRICRYLGMEFEVDLGKPEISFEGKETDFPESEKLNWPLCLRISWEEAP